VRAELVNGGLKVRLRLAGRLSMWSLHKFMLNTILQVCASSCITSCAQSAGHQKPSASRWLCCWRAAARHPRDKIAGLVTQCMTGLPPPLPGAANQRRGNVHHKQWREAPGVLVPSAVHIQPRQDPQLQPARVHPSIPGTWGSLTRMPVAGRTGVSRERKQVARGVWLRRAGSENPNCGPPPSPHEIVCSDLCTQSVCKGLNSIHDAEN
jgi:hypothetical protein